MTRKKLESYLEDLRCLNIIPKRYRTPQGMSREYWGAVRRRYLNAEKAIISTDYRWRIIEYDDGRKELAYLRVLQKGFLSGLYPAIYRGIIIPRRIGYGTFAHIKNIRLAF